MVFIFLYQRYEPSLKVGVMDCRCLLRMNDFFCKLDSAIKDPQGENIMNNVNIFLINTESTIDVPFGTQLVDIARTIEGNSTYRYLAASVDNRIVDLKFRIVEQASVEFIDITNFEGYRTYQRTLTFILQAVVEKLFPGRHLFARNGMGDGVYCEIEGLDSVDDETCDRLRDGVRWMIESNVDIEKKRELTSALIHYCRKYGYSEKVALMESKRSLYSQYWKMGLAHGIFFGPLAPSTGYVPMFDIQPYGKGLCILQPSKRNPEVLGSLVNARKVDGIFREFQDWVEIMGVPTVGRLNTRIQQGDGSELIKIAEAFHEKRLADIADSIVESCRTRGTRIVLLSGPSSSGKTTTANRLGIQLRVNGLHPVLISLDDYFVPREQTPRDENGEYDYEALEAIDIPQLNSHLNRLFAGESVAIPRYDFITGTRQWHENPLKLDDKSILIMEGIHGLNPNLTPNIPDNLKFRIFVSCFTSVSMDEVSRIYTTDNRLLRRITRDFYTRGYSAADNIARWPSVRAGEDRNIWPYAENADVMFNSSLFYEISALRSTVEPILREVPDSMPEFATAHSLLKFLENFTPLRTDEIPPTSILREFIGGSSFKY